uniref:Alpha-2-macroglobulin n=1 Tax=Oryctolagus cuniculus TaxID=9986 RepID=A0A5F9DIU6_RABIT
MACCNSGLNCLFNTCIPHNHGYSSSTALNFFSSRQYMMLLPYPLHTETPEKCCLSLSHLNETVTVSASIVSHSGTISLFDDLVADKDLFHCVSFTLPRSSFHGDTGELLLKIRGPTHELHKRSTVWVKNTESIVFVQTDKPIYKPSQSVEFRVVSVNKDLRPLHELPVSYIQDPRMNRIMQWQNVKSENGLKQLSFSLSSEPILGSYKIVILTQSGMRTEHSFTVDEFGMVWEGWGGKVESVLCGKPFVSTYFSCDRYTYGKPVPGHVTICICPHGSHFLNRDQSCLTQQVNTSMFQLKDSRYLIRKLQVNAKIKEEGTGLEFTGTGIIEVTRIITKVTFVKVNKYFRQGIPVFGQVRLEDGKGVPIPNETIFIQAHSANFFLKATTDEHGLAQFSVNTIHATSNILIIRVSPEEPCLPFHCMNEVHQDARHTAKHVFSLNKSYVQLEPVAGALPCGQTHTAKAHYILNAQVLGELKELIFYYLVSIMAKGSIIRSGTHVLSVDPGALKGHFLLSVPVETDLAPLAGLLIYAVLPDGEVIGDSAKLEIERCLHNKVDLGFSPAQGLPASQTHLRVEASPQSLCALRAVDKSVLLMKPEAELSAFKVGSHHTQDMGLKVFTNLKIKYPKLCTFYSMPGKITNQFISHSSITVSKITNTHLLSVHHIVILPSSSGMAEVEATVPDTITEWKAEALCLSNDTGLGLSPIASLRAFKPFFVELTLPYSVIRGEAFTLTATVLNYLPKCIRVSVQLKASPDFTAIPVQKEQDSYCLCGNERETLSWLVTPTSLGNVNFSMSAEAIQSPDLCGNEMATVPETEKSDTVVKLLLVEPEGIKMEHTFNSLLCVSDAGVSEKLALKLPPGVVKESARASVSVLGDILGSPIKNTHSLLQMPYGCGEQNIALFAPNIYVLKYLNETHQLTPELKSKAINFLNAGYQKQLNYKHKDGSYSAFGDKNGNDEGNTWLTAFVLKSFAQAQPFAFIDKAHITQALTWLSQKQKDDGCFRSSGNLFNNAMKGGVDDEVTLSAYITIALLEIPLPVTDPVVRNALFCLESAWNTAQEKTNGSHVYTKALLAYAFALAGNQGRRNEVLKSLDEEAIKEDDSIHWERPQKPKSSEGHFFHPRAPSAEVEMTSYVLLAHLTAWPAPASEDLTTAKLIVKWITKQQNAHGGFSSTQDTVVALHALSRYGAATFARTETVKVAIQSLGTFSTNFQVENSNRLLLQQVSLPDLPGEYDITVSGEGCVYIQTALKYNVFLEKKESAFDLQVQTTPPTCDGPKAHTSFQISINVSYIGSRQVSNMVIVDIKMISGFIPLKPTVKMLTRSNHVSRAEVSNNNVLIYLEQVTNQMLNFSFTVLQDIPVRNLKPALVTVYDYYETGE